MEKCERRRVFQGGDPSYLPAQIQGLVEKHDLVNKPKPKKKTVDKSFMSGYNLRVEDYTKQNFSKILKKIIFYTVAILVIFLSVYFIIILDTDWHRIGSGEGILKQLSYFVGLDFKIMP